jgi:putative salt-induced outer membrane protein YdiY
MGLIAVAFSADAEAAPGRGQGQAAAGFQTPAPDRSTTPHQVTTSDGSVIEGTIVTMQSGSLTMKTKFSQPVSVKQKSVVAIETTDAIEIVMYDSRIYRGTMSTGSDGSIVITPTDGGAQATVTWADIAELYALPPRWEGSLTFGFSENSGNTETLNTNFGLDGSRFGESNRFTGNASFSLVETFSSSDSRKASGSLQYDHYLRPRLYAHVTEELTHDLKQDLSLQSASHVGIGYDIVERPHSLLSVELGVGLLVNRYDVDSSADDTALSGRGAVHVTIPFNHGITLDDDFVFFIHSESHVTNTLVVSFKLTSAWALKVTSKLQVSSDPSTLADEWDHQTLMGVTYSF